MSQLQPIPELRFRYSLFPLALFYWGVLFWRNLFYRIGFFVTRSLPCTVISVGNLTAGGTGKTPAVIYLARLLKSRGLRPAILSRGYGRRTSGPQLVTDGEAPPLDWSRYGDEPTLMAGALQGIPIAVDENRYRGGMFLCQRFKPQVILLDDAFQHRGLERDLDIVLINSQDDRAIHKLLPYGLLREPWYHLRRADLIFFTKANLKSPSHFLRSRARLSKVPHFLSTIEAGQELPGLKGDTLTLPEAKGKAVLALSAVGDPLGFQRTLEGIGLEVADHLAFHDHHVYTPSDLEDLRNRFQRHRAALVITTEKDLIKLRSLPRVDFPVYALPIRFVPQPAGERAVLDHLDLVISGTHPSRT